MLFYFQKKKCKDINPYKNKKNNIFMININSKEKRRNSFLNMKI